MHIQKLPFLSSSLQLRVGSNVSFIHFTQKLLLCEDKAKSEGKWR